MTYDLRSTIRPKCATLVLLLSAIHSLPSTTFAQGSLAPPGAPAPTMKSLAQIEPRTAISSLPFVVANGGSYYLTTNLSGIAGTNGITIIVDNVTLDLNGFAISGVSGSSNGILVAGVLKNNISIRNGTVRGWGRWGVDAGNLNNGQLLDLRVSNNGGGGAKVGSFSSLLRCVATANTSYGLYSGASSLIKDSTGGGNSGDGITLGFDSTVADCTAGGNTGNGIVAGSDCTIRGCTASGNTASGINTAGSCRIEVCTAADNGQNGIWPNDSTAVSRCTANGNTGDGISINAFTSVTDCMANDNIGNGIYAGGDFNRIESNFTAHNADRGIRLHSVGSSIVVRNTAAANTNGDLPASAASIGPAQSPSTATNPAANFQM